MVVEGVDQEKVVFMRVARLSVDASPGYQEKL